MPLRADECHRRSQNQWKAQVLQPLWCRWQTFIGAASAISSEIYTTSQKLQELSTLVRDSSRSLFNDPSEKITVYVHDISEDIRRLKGKLESAQQYVQSKKDARGAKTQVTEHNEMVVKGLKTGFDTAAKSFRGVVKQRAENVKAQQARKKEFGQPSDPHRKRPNCSSVGPRFMANHRAAIAHCHVRTVRWRCARAGTRWCGQRRSKAEATTEVVGAAVHS